MSVEWISKAFLLDLPSPEKFVAVVLADHAGFDGCNAWPSVATICQKTGLCESEVRKCLKNLRVKGYIAVQKPATQHIPTVYRLTFQTSTTQTSTTQTSTTQTSTTQTSIMEQENAPEVHQVVPRGLPHGPDPSLTVNKRTARGKVLAFDISELEENRNYREDRNAAMTSNGSKGSELTPVKLTGNFREFSKKWRHLTGKKAPSTNTNQRMYEEVCERYGGESAVLRRMEIWIGDNEGSDFLKKPVAAWKFLHDGIHEIDDEDLNPPARPKERYELPAERPAK